MIYVIFLLQLAIKFVAFLPFLHLYCFVAVGSARYTVCKSCYSTV